MAWLPFLTMMEIFFVPVDELHDPGEEDVGEVGIDQLQTFGSVMNISENKDKNSRKNHDKFVIFGLF